MTHGPDMSHMSPLIPWSVSELSPMVDSYRRFASWRRQLPKGATSWSWTTTSSLWWWKFLKILLSQSGKLQGWLTAAHSHWPMRPPASIRWLGQVWAPWTSLSWCAFFVQSAQNCRRERTLAKSWKFCWKCRSRRWRSSSAYQSKELMLCSKHWGCQQRSKKNAWMRQDARQSFPYHGCSRSLQKDAKENFNCKSRRNTARKPNSSSWFAVPDARCRNMACMFGASTLQKTISFWRGVVTLFARWPNQMASSKTIHLVWAWFLGHGLAFASRTALNSTPDRGKSKMMWSEPYATGMQTRNCCALYGMEPTKTGSDQGNSNQTKVAFPPIRRSRIIALRQKLRSAVSSRSLVNMFACRRRTRSPLVASFGLMVEFRRDGRSRLSIRPPKDADFDVFRVAFHSETTVPLYIMYSWGKPLRVLLNFTATCAGLEFRTSDAWHVLGKRGEG